METEEQPNLIQRIKDKISGKEVGATFGEIGFGTGLDIATKGLLVTPIPGSRIAYGGINFLGGAGANYVAQQARTEEDLAWHDRDWGEVVSSGLLGIIPGMSAKAGKLTRFVGRPNTYRRAATFGSASGIGDQFIRQGIDEQRLPTPSEIALGASVGGVAGPVFKKALDEASVVFKKFKGKKPEAINLNDVELKHLSFLQRQILQAKQNGLSNEDITTLIKNYRKAESEKEIMKQVDELLDQDKVLEAQELVRSIGGELNLATRDLVKVFMKATKEGNLTLAENTFQQFSDVLKVRHRYRLDVLKDRIDDTYSKTFFSSEDVLDDPEEYARQVITRAANNPSKMDELVNLGILKRPLGPKDSGAAVQQIDKARAVFLYNRAQMMAGRGGKIKQNLYRDPITGDEFTYRVTEAGVRKLNKTNMRYSVGRARDIDKGSYISKQEFVDELGPDLGEWSYDINERLIREMDNLAGQQFEKDHIAPVSKLADNAGGWRTHTNFILLWVYQNRAKSAKRISDDLMDLLGVPRTKKEAIRSVLLNELMSPNSRINPIDAQRLIMADLGVVRFAKEGKDWSNRVFENPEELKLLFSDIKADDIIAEINDETGKQLLSDAIYSDTEVSAATVLKQAKDILNKFSYAEFKQALSEAIALNRYRLEQIAIRVKNQKGPFKDPMVYEQFNPSNPKLK